MLGFSPKISFASHRRTHADSQLIWERILRKVENEVCPAVVLCFIPREGGSFLFSAVLSHGSVIMSLPVSLISTGH